MKKAELEAQVAALKRQLRNIQMLLDTEQMHWQRICNEHNEIIHVLDDLFGFQVGAKDFEHNEPLWDITDNDGRMLVHHQKNLAEAYRQAIVAHHALTSGSLNEKGSNQ